MELAYTLTGPVIASCMGQGRTPTDLTVDHLKGKHFAYYHEKQGRCVVCAYKRQTPRERTPKQRITVPSVMYSTVLSVLKNTTHL